MGLTPDKLEEMAEDVEKRVKAEIERDKARAALKQANADKRHLAKEVEEARAREDFRASINVAQKEVVIKPGPLGKYAACPVIMCSDWHAEERVDPKTVNGRNEYNPEIFAKRAKSMTKGVLWRIEHAPWDLREAVLWLGGDLISGHIHEDLAESNYLSPTQATLLVQDAVSTMIHSLLASERIDRLHVICNDGNHGRTTVKRRVQTRCDNSYEWLMYQQLSRLFAEDKRVQWTIASGSHVYADILGFKVRFCHGDECRYGGGVGGIGIPLRKATDAWNSNIPADITVMGHWHQLCSPHPDIAVNGSLIGWGPFAQAIKARFQPPQQGLFFVSKRWGMLGLEPIYVEDA